MFHPAMQTIEFPDGTTRVRIDAAALDPEDFVVRSTLDGGFFIFPRASKHRWTDAELPFRSLVLFPDGTVRSSGFPKFRNYGEQADEGQALSAAFGRGEVTLADKRDGSLIIIDMEEDELRVRSRGMMSLSDQNDFRRGVENTLDAYPFLRRLRRDDGARREVLEALSKWSLLYEYTSPSNRIILAYERAELHLLGMVNKHTLEVVVHGPQLAAASVLTGVPLVATEEHSTSELTIYLRDIAARISTEGVVAAWMDEHGRTRLTKMKSREYLALHALRMNLEGRMAPLLYVLDSRPETWRDQLMHLGVDVETLTMLETEAKDYFAKLLPVELQIVDLVAWVTPLTTQDRKTAVARIREELVTRGLSPDPWFHAAMLLFRPTNERDNLRRQVIGPLLFQKGAREMLSLELDPTIRQLLPPHLRPAETTGDQADERLPTQTNAPATQGVLPAVTAADATTLPQAQSVSTRVRR